MTGKTVDIEASSSSSTSGKRNSTNGTATTTTLSPAGNGQLPFANPFDDASIRRHFISKVFGILAAMLTITFAIMSVFLFV